MVLQQSSDQLVVNIRLIDMGKYKMKLKKCENGLQSVAVPPTGDPMSLMSDTVSMAMAGSSAGLPGIIAGGALGLGTGLLNMAGQSKERKVAKDHNKLVKANAQYSSVNSQNTQATQYAKGTKAVEVERDELIFDSKFNLKHDFKGGKTHEQGGEPYVATEGDIIFPGKQREEVLRAYALGKHDELEAMRQKLPVDSSAKVKNQDGNRGVTQREIKKALKSGQTLRDPEGEKLFAENEKELNSFVPNIPGTNRVKIKGQPRTFSAKYEEEKRLKQNAAVDKKEQANASATTKEAKRKEFITKIAEEEGVTYEQADRLQKVNPNWRSQRDFKDFKNSLNKNTVHAATYDPVTGSNKAKYPDARTHANSVPKAPGLGAWTPPSLVESPVSKSASDKSGGKATPSVAPSTAPSVTSATTTKPATPVSGVSTKSSSKPVTSNSFGADADGWFKDSRTGRAANKATDMNGRYNANEAGEAFSSGELLQPGEGTNKWPEAVYKAKDGSHYLAPEKTIKPGVPAIAKVAAPVLKNLGETILKPEKAVMTELNKKPGLLERDGNPLENIGKYAGIANNLMQSFKKPEKVDRDYLKQSELVYEDMSEPTRRESRTGAAVQTANARNVSGGSAANLRNNAAGAQAANVDRISKVNQFEAGRADQIHTQNIGIRNQTAQVNNQKFDQYNQMDAQNRAVTDAYRDTAMNDISKVSQINEQTKYMKELDQKKLESTENQFKFMSDAFTNFGVNADKSGTVFKDGTKKEKEDEEYRKGTRKIKVKTPKKK